ncbi:MAG: hypothetical protein NTX85_04225 [Candidatus Nomurabacteria bacterium]|nr:hypothetical protein [Candidatus Nomurabacteria bacterium]
MENSDLLFVLGIVVLGGLLFGGFQLVMLWGASNLTSKISKFFKVDLNVDKNLKKEDLKKMDFKQIVSILIKMLSRVLIIALILIVIPLLLSFLFKFFG